MEDGTRARSTDVEVVDPRGCNRPLRCVACRLPCAARLRAARRRFPVPASDQPRGACVAFFAGQREPRGPIRSDRLHHSVRCFVGVRSVRGTPELGLPPWHLATERLFRPLPVGSGRGPAHLRAQRELPAWRALLLLALGSVVPDGLRRKRALEHPRPCAGAGGLPHQVQGRQGLGVLEVRTVAGRRLAVSQATHGSHEDVRARLRAGRGCGLQAARRAPRHGRPRDRVTGYSAVGERAVPGKRHPRASLSPGWGRARARLGDSGECRRGEAVLRPELRHCDAQVQERSALVCIREPRVRSGGAACCCGALIR